MKDSVGPFLCECKTKEIQRVTVAFAGLGGGGVRKVFLRPKTSYMKQRLDQFFFLVAET
jgi:hypothetical protein